MKVRPARRSLYRESALLKFTLLLLLVILVIYPLGGSGQTSTSSPIVTVGSGSAAPNGKTTVKISVSGISGAGLSDFQGRVTYNPAVIIVTGFPNVNGYTVFAQRIDNTKGEATFIVAQVAGSYLKQGEILGVTVQGVGATGQSSTLALTLFTFNDKSGNNIPRTIRNGTITIQATAPSGATNADFSFAPLHPNPGDSVQFSDHSSASAGITSWQWSFGDGASSTAQNPVHVYNSAGRFTVTLTITDQNGTVASASKTISVGGAASGAVAVHNFPNPARSQTTFSYALPTGTTSATLLVYSISDGAPVWRKALDVSGDSLTWNLRDSRGEALPNGGYAYLVSALVSGRTLSSAVGKLVIQR
ncbi:MAG TPA: PKD domain-containing protein [Candidatus Fraserbacteria bacterium]|nr:PKD domain-containing protein [Candidatus Fraserbacteria bacterium]